MLGSSTAQRQGISRGASIVPEAHCPQIRARWTGIAVGHGALRALWADDAGGPIAAALILTFLPEIGTLDRKQAGSLAGLVPHCRESGQWKGKSFIGGGRKPLRDALYMPALVAMRFNPDLKSKYAELRAGGKPAKVAIVALMRKLLETANALVKANRLWTPKPA